MEGSVGIHNGEERQSERELVRHTKRAAGSKPCSRQTSAWAADGVTGVIVEVVVEVEVVVVVEVVVEVEVVVMVEVEVEEEL